jgi:hypothetical protein
MNLCELTEAQRRSAEFHESATPSLRDSPTMSPSDELRTMQGKE